MQTFYNTGSKKNVPDKIIYEPLPNGKAHVRIAHDITWDDESERYTSNEVEFFTDLSKDEVEENEDVLFNNDGTIPSNEPTDAERLDAIEEAIMELAEVISNG